ncbi:unnamed protein product, partial [Owenia fusiformis]
IHIYQSVPTLVKCILLCQMSRQSCELVVFDSSSQICKLHRMCDMIAENVTHPSTTVAASVTGSTICKSGTYIGCFEDQPIRDLASGGIGNTPQLCMDSCSQAGYMYSGNQFSHQCMCGNEYGRYGLRPDSECNMACAGNNTLKCGAGWRNSIYKT